MQGPGVAGTRIGIRVPPCRPTPELTLFARQVERSGFDAIYVPDSQTLWRDAYLSLHAAAMSTERLTLATAVSNVVTRHPSVIAGAVRTLDEVASGRIVLGLGVGHSSVEPIGLRAATRAQLRSGVEQIRRLLSGDTVAYGEARARLHHSRPTTVPVHLAATGPRNLRLAGEIGDGAILLSGAAPGPVGAAITRVQEGARSAGRAPHDPEITVSAHALITDDVERDARIIKPIVASVAQRGGAAALRDAGIDPAVPAVVHGVEPDLVHANDWDHAVEVCSRWISDRDAVAFARSFCLFGTADQIVDRIRALSDLGVTSVFLQHVGSWDLPEELVDTVGAHVIPRIRARSARRDPV